MVSVACVVPDQYGARRMTRRFALLVIGVALLGACRSEIGDECSLTQDCNRTEVERICLTEGTQRFPGGYCTSFNCGPDSCADEAICVAYRAALGNSPECSEATNSQRLQQTYCMRACESADDCRGGYACVELTVDNPWGARSLDSDGRRRICMPAYTEPDMPPVRDSDVCISRLPSAADGGADSADAMAPAQPTDASADAAVAPAGDASPLDASLLDASSSPTDAGLADGNAPRQPTDASDVTLASDAAFTEAGVDARSLDDASGVLLDAANTP